MESVKRPEELPPDPCPTCSGVHPACACGRARVICPPDESGEPFGWCEICEAEYHTNTVLERVDKSVPGRAEERERFLAYVHARIDALEGRGYQREPLELLAWSILIALDGWMKDLPPYGLIPNGADLPGNIAGDLERGFLHAKPPHKR